MTDTVLAAEALEVLATGTPGTQLDAQVLEVLTSAAADAVLAAVFIEVLTPTNPLKGFWGTPI